MPVLGRGAGGTTKPTDAHQSELVPSTTASLAQARSLCSWHASWFQHPRRVISCQEMPGGLELLNSCWPLPEPNEIASLLLLLYSLDRKFFPDPALWLQDKNMCPGCSSGGKHPPAGFIRWDRHGPEEGRAQQARGRASQGSLRRGPTRVPGRLRRLDRALAQRGTAEP